MVAHIKDVMESISQLPADQLKQVAAQVSFLRYGSQGGESVHALRPNSDPDIEREMIGAVIRQECRTFGFRVPPDSVLQSSRHWPRFVKSIPCFLNYVDKYFSPKSRTERIKVIRVLVGCILKHLQSHHIPRGHRSITDCLVKIHDVVDDQFPGYRESGFLPLIIHPNQLHPVSV